jgi:flagellar biosynthesis protein FlhB
MDDDYAQKTEKATPKKLADARKKGLVAKSNNLTTSILFAFICIFLAFFSKSLIINLLLNFRFLLSHLMYQYDNPSIVSFWVSKGLHQFLWILAPLLIGAFLVALLANVVQVGFFFSAYPLIPNWSRVNIFNVSNYKYLFSLKFFTKILFLLLWMIVVVFSFLLLIQTNIPEIIALLEGSPKNITWFIFKICIALCSIYSLSYLFLALADFFFQKYQFLKEMRMTKQEVQYEKKQEQADFNVKTKIQSAMHSNVDLNLRSLIPTAQLVICDADNIAVVISFNPEQMEAPKCIAKSAGFKTVYLKYLARVYKVPIVENNMLADALFKTKERNGKVSEHLYHTIAVELVKVKKQSQWKRMA